MKIIKAYFRYFIVLFSVISGITNAAQTNEEKTDDGFNWEADLGLALTKSRGIVDGLETEDTDLGIEVLLAGGIYYKNFYIESVPRSDHPLTFGYAFIKEEDFQINLVAESWFFSISEDYQQSGNKLDGLEDRLSSLELGIEVLSIHRDIDIRFRLLQDSLSRHNGTLASLELGKALFTRTLLVMPSISLTLISENAVEHYYGISADEVRADRPEYSPGSAWVGSARIYVEKPMGTSWSMIGYAGVAHFSNAISDSPIVSPRSNSYKVGLGVLWTF